MPRLSGGFPNRSRYRAYLIRLWQDTPDGSWRASAQSVLSGEISRFGSLPALFAYLEMQAGGAQQTNAPPRDGEYPCEP